MDDQRFGTAVRAVRVKRGITQRELARAAGVSDGSVSRLERGLIDGMAMSTIRAIARAVDVRVELLPRSRAADLERIVAGAHAALAEAVVTWLSRFAGWIVRPEVGFSSYGDRGVIDLVCWHQGRRTLLVIELKTELVDINQLLATLNRYARNAAVAVAPMGWTPVSVCQLLIVSDTDFNRDRVAGHAALFAAALPLRAKAIRDWLRDPVGDLAGLMFFANRHPTSTIQRLSTVRRVRNVRRASKANGRTCARPHEASSSTAEHEFAAASRGPGFPGRRSGLSCR
jgi:transcriptional regulator with XRE-family HTH domain